MGTTKTSGWAMLFFLVGFTFVFTPAVGGGILGFAAGAAMIGYSCVLFRSARPKEEI